MLRFDVGAAQILRLAAVSLYFAGSMTLMATPSSSQTFTTSFTNAATQNIDSASALFSYINGGSTLQIQLTNTSTFNVYGNNDVLSGLFFAIAGSPNLTLVSEIGTKIVNPSACASAQITYCTQSTAPDVGREWGYQFSSAGFSSTNLSTSAQYGVASAGYSSLNPTFGNGNITRVATSPALDTNQSLDGLPFGIVGSNWTSTNGTSGPFVQGSVTFDFNLPSGITAPKISNVTFAYGTAPDGSSKAPEPATIAILLAGLGALAVARGRLSA